MEKRRQSGRRVKKEGTREEGRIFQRPSTYLDVLEDADKLLSTEIDALKDVDKSVDERFLLASTRPTLPGSSGSGNCGSFRWRDFGLRSRSFVTRGRDFQRRSLIHLVVESRQEFFFFFCRHLNHVFGKRGVSSTDWLSSTPIQDDGILDSIFAPKAKAFAVGFELYPWLFWFSSYFFLL